MTLDLSDALWPNQALREFSRSGSTDVVDSYQQDTSTRTCRAQQYSLRVTSMLHIAPEATESDKMRSLGDLESLTRSRYAQPFLAEGHNGWPYEGDNWM